MPTPHPPHKHPMRAKHKAPSRVGSAQASCRAHAHAYAPNTPTTTDNNTNINNTTGVIWGVMAAVPPPPSPLMPFLPYHHPPPLTPRPPRTSRTHTSPPTHRHTRAAAPNPIIFYWRARFYAQSNPLGLSVERLKLLGGRGRAQGAAHPHIISSALGGGAWVS
jgi:hypothetical protein